MLDDLKRADSFDFSNLEIKTLVHRSTKKKKVKYADFVTAFDIETTNIDKYRQSVMYIWQMQLDDVCTVYGRSWDEFKEFLKKLEEAVPDDCYLVCLVHNLSFEFQFIKSIIDVDDVFAMDDRKILRVRSGKLEFRCTYLHSNMSLDKYLKFMDIENKKLEYNYTKKRYPWTKMSDAELQYCVNDVKGLVQAYKKEMDMDGDNLYTIPLTSTGYIRRIAKQVLGPHRRWIRMILPDLECFHALRKAFRGGDTHSNRFNTNILIDSKNVGPVWTWDLSSCYPAEMMKNDFPRKFTKMDVSNFETEYRHGKACLLHLYLENLKQKRPRCGYPYIPKAKCENLVNAEIDNGRVLHADSLEIYVTEIDFEIIADEYEFKYEILDLWTATKSKLPDSFRKMLLDLYQDKTKLKGVDDYLYQKKKNRFNAAYGMSVQNPCKCNYEFKEGMMVLLDEPLEALIEQYHKTGWLPYQWGVWVTAYARRTLHKGLHIIDDDDFVYSDTDSIKTLGDYTEAFEKLNNELMDKSLSAVDSKGKIHYIGVFECEGGAKRFKTMGAKKYCYEDEEGVLHLTVSGVNKKLGAAELKKIERFKEGFIFRKGGGLAAVYNDFPEQKQIRVQNKTLTITSNVALFPSTYTLGLSVDYGKLIHFLMNEDIRSALHYER